MVVRILLVAATAALLAGVCEGFPDGAPIEACILPRRNSPNHPGTKSQSQGSHQYLFTASEARYGPGTTIHVQISGPSFKGFFVQARDQRTNKWIGHFVEDKNNKAYPECSAVTHVSIHPKSDLLLTWVAPRDHSGEVYFTGTILERYDKYWSDMVAKVVPRRARGG